MKKTRVSKGFVLASCTAALLSSTCVLANNSSASSSEMMVMCNGINACKGHSDCKTATSACKGMNQCKGTGWVFLSKEECLKKGGSISN